VSKKNRRRGSHSIRRGGKCQKEERQKVTDKTLPCPAGGSLTDTSVGEVREKGGETGETIGRNSVVQDLKKRKRGGSNKTRISWARAACSFAPVAVAVVHGQTAVAKKGKGGVRARLASSEGGGASSRERGRNSVGTGLPFPVHDAIPGQAGSVRQKSGEEGRDVHSETQGR